MSDKKTKEETSDKKTAMSGAIEFTQKDIIANQMIIAETFIKMKKMISANKKCLEKESVDYAAKSTQALCGLWCMFEENHMLLMEADLQNDKYYTKKIYMKINKYFSFLTSILPVLPRKTDRKDSLPSLRDETIKEQRKNFDNLYKKIRCTDLDFLKFITDMEHRQKRLRVHWKPIDDTHSIIRQYHSLLPDVTYELKFMRFKNMYEITLSLLNYKIDSVLHPENHIIPRVGIPTWRMFDDTDKLPAFSAKSGVWNKLEKLRDVAHYNKLKEGDKRLLLIRAFLEYKKPASFSDNYQYVGGTGNYTAYLVRSEQTQDCIIE